MNGHSNAIPSDTWMQHLISTHTQTQSNLRVDLHENTVLTSLLSPSPTTQSADIACRHHSEHLNRAIIHTHGFTHTHTHNVHVQSRFWGRFTTTQCRYILTCMHAHMCTHTHVSITTACSRTQISSLWRPECQCSVWVNVTAACVVLVTVCS